MQPSVLLKYTLRFFRMQPRVILIYTLGFSSMQPRVKYISVLFPKRLQVVSLKSALFKLFEHPCQGVRGPGASLGSILPL